VFNKLCVRIVNTTLISAEDNNLMKVLPAEITTVEKDCHKVSQQVIVSELAESLSRMQNRHNIERYHH